MQLHEQPDSEVVRQIQSGDDSAFDELMGRYKRPVVNFVFRMLGNADDADDVAQEVFVRVYQKLDTYRPETKFSTWLFALARNAAIDRLRWRKRHPTESIDPDSPLVAATDTAQEVDARELGELIAAAVSELPEDQRTVLVLAVARPLRDKHIATREDPVEGGIVVANSAERPAKRCGEGCVPSWNDVRV